MVPLDPVVLHDETLNILLAGRDTVSGTCVYIIVQVLIFLQTAGTLTLIIYCLCMYPQVRERLRAEIIDKVGCSRRPTYADIKEMRYLRAVINETLRLYPLV